MTIESGADSSLKSYLEFFGVASALPFLAGVVCAAGNELQFYGGTLAGFAASDLVQAFPVVGMVWGRCLFADFEGAPPRVVRTLVAVYASYLAAVLFLFLSVR